jgi:hypothetical protein
MTGIYLFGPDRAAVLTRELHRQYLAQQGAERARVLSRNGHEIVFSTNSIEGAQHRILQGTGGFVWRTLHPATGLNSRSHLFIPTLDTC